MDLLNRSTGAPPIGLDTSACFGPGGRYLLGTFEVRKRAIDMRKRAMHIPWTLRVIYLFYLISLASKLGGTSSTLDAAER